MREGIKALLPVLIFIVGQQMALAQGLKVTTFKLGYFDPKDAKSGFLFGVNLEVPWTRTWTSVLG